MSTKRQYSGKRNSTRVARAMTLILCSRILMNTESSYALPNQNPALEVSEAAGPSLHDSSAGGPRQCQEIVVADRSQGTSQLSKTLVLDAESALHDLVEALSNRYVSNENVVTVFIGKHENFTTALVNFNRDEHRMSDVLARAENSKKLISLSQQSSELRDQLLEAVHKFQSERTKSPSRGNKQHLIARAIETTLKKTGDELKTSAEKVGEQLKLDEKKFQRMQEFVDLIKLELASLQSLYDRLGQVKVVLDVEAGHVDQKTFLDRRAFLRGNIIEEIGQIRRVRDNLITSRDALGLTLPLQQEALRLATTELQTPQPEVPKANGLAVVSPQLSSFERIVGSMKEMTQKIFGFRSVDLPQGFREIEKYHLQNPFAPDRRVYIYSHLGDSFKESSFTKVKSFAQDFYQVYGSFADSVHREQTVWAELGTGWKGFYVGQKLKRSLDRGEAELEVIGFFRCGDILLKESLQTDLGVTELPSLTRYSPRELSEIRDTGRVRKGFGRTDNSGHPETDIRILRKNMAATGGADLLLFNYDPHDLTFMMGPIQKNQVHYYRTNKQGFAVSLQDRDWNDKIETSQGKWDLRKVGLRRPGFLWRGFKIGDRISASELSPYNLEILAIAWSGDFLVALENPRLPHSPHKVAMISDKELRILKMAPKIEVASEIKDSDLFWSHSVGEKVLWSDMQFGNSPYGQRARFFVGEVEAHDPYRRDQIKLVHAGTMPKENLIRSTPGLKWGKLKIGGIYDYKAGTLGSHGPIQVIGFTETGHVVYRSLDWRTTSDPSYHSRDYLEKREIEAEITSYENLMGLIEDSSALQ